MPIDVDTPESPGWWLKFLQAKLDAKRKRIQPLYDRFEGNAPLPRSMEAAPESAQRFFKTSRTNLADMLVKAVRYRLKVARIHTSVDAGEAGDAAAWLAWRKAGMQVEGPEIIRHMLISGDGFGMVAMDEDGPAATSEDPRQVITEHDPVRQSRMRAAAKFFRDEVRATDFAYLYLPGRVFVARRERKASAGSAVSKFSTSWDWSEDHGGAAGKALPQGFDRDMMIVRYRNDEAVGDYERHTDILDRLDHLILQGMVIATLQAFKQRGIKVADEDMPDRDPDTGEEIDYDEVFSADPGALWKLPASADMWESGAVDLTPITTLATKELERISAVTFTPLSMFTPEGANQSAQGASLVREGMTFKVEDKQERIGEAHALTASLIFRLSGEALAASADPFSIQIGWAPAERFSLTERAQASVALKSAGVPFRTMLREAMQFSPEQIARAESERMNDLMALTDIPAATAAADGAQAASPVVPEGQPTPADLKARFDALGIAIRAGVDPDDAARQVGLPGVKFTGMTPVSLRPQGE